MNVEEFPNDRDIINNMLDEAKDIEKAMLSLKNLKKVF